MPRQKTKEELLDRIDELEVENETLQDQVDSIADIIEGEEENEIRIRRAATKTDAGCRVIPLNNQAAWALTRLLERAKHLGVNEPDHFILPAFRYRHTKEGDLEGGTGYDPTKPMKTWRTAWRSLVGKAGIPGLRFHDLRHHCITKLAEKGVPEQTLMAIAGHVTKEMLQHYSHIRMQAKREAVASLDDGSRRLDSPAGEAAERQQRVN